MVMRWLRAYTSARVKRTSPTLGCRGPETCSAKGTACRARQPVTMHSERQPAPWLRQYQLSQTSCRCLGCVPTVTLLCWR